MALAPGTRLGVYELVGAIGAGGMGEVYRARDPRLGRDVAIKVLPLAFAADPERLQRFEHEARAAAALNHPNILAVYDIGQHDGAPFIVAELLEGETLRERLRHGALPVRKAIDFGVQIAHGLAAAHEKGIVHRDLKPENLFLTTDGRVKILDFGLAKLTHAELALAGLSILPTAAPDTLPGMVLGTVGYMAPEQVRGHTADHRADIFALGTVLYEMLSGRRAFRGDTAIDTMTAILKENPQELPVVERHIPPTLERVVERCLEKNPAARFQSTRDLAFALEGVTGHSEASIPHVSAQGIWAGHAISRVAWAAGVILLMSLIAVGVARYVRQAPDTPRAYLSSILPPEDATPDAAPLALSPDGSRLAFVARGRDGQSRLWLRQLDGPSPYALPGTEGAGQPFWSPDSRYIAFIAAGALRRIDVSGGAPATLCRVAGNAGGTWNADGVLLFAANQPGTSDGALWRTSARAEPVRWSWHSRLPAVRSNISGRCSSLMACTSCISSWVPKDPRGCTSDR
jgi:hypothetical protein